MKLISNQIIIEIKAEVAKMNNDGDMDFRVIIFPGLLQLFLPNINSFFNLQTHSFINIYQKRFNLFTIVIRSYLKFDAQSLLRNLPKFIPILLRRIRINL
jgi:hypothetical protein